MDLEKRAEVRDGVLVLRLMGELTGPQTAEFKAWATDQVKNAPQEVQVDCEKLHFIDSRGLGCLIYVRKCVTEQEGSMILINVSGWLRKFLQVTGLEEILCGTGVEDQA